MGLGTLDALAAWLRVDRGGLLLTGDQLVATRLFALVRDRVDHVPVTPGTTATDAEQLRGRAEVVAIAAASAMAEVGPAVVPAGRVLALADDPAAVPDWLLRRCTLLVHVPHVSDPQRLRALLAGGRPHLPEVTVDSPRIEEAVELLATHGIADHGIDTASAVLAGCRGVGWDGIDLLRAFVVAPRTGAGTPPQTGATADTGEPDDHPTPPEQPPVTEDAGQLRGRTRHEDTTPPEDVEAAAVPPVRRRVRTRDRIAWVGRRGAPQEGTERGRIIRRVSKREGMGIDIPGTLQAAAPWQQQRRAQTGRSGVVLRREDLRSGIRSTRGAGLSILVVDASGSMGRGAIQAAKRTALAILEDNYRNRDRVAIILVRGPRATVGLAPTRSLSRARDSLRRLPTGGGTPLASGLLQATRMAARYDPERVRALVLTDGRANLALTPQGDPKHDARASYRQLRDRVGDVAVVPIRSRQRRRDPTAWLTAPETSLPIPR